MSTASCTRIDLDREGKMICLRNWSVWFYSFWRKIGLWPLAVMFSFPFQERERNLECHFIMWERELRERRRSWNVEYGNENVGHVPIPRLLSSGPHFGRLKL